MNDLPSSLSEDPHADITSHHFRTQLNTLNAIIFLFHGRGSNGYGIQEQLGRYLLQDDVLIVAPNASGV